MNQKDRRFGLLGALSLSAVALLVGLLAVSCNDYSPKPIRVVGIEEPVESPYFEDVTASCGINHNYRNGEESGHLAILESLGGGAGVLDFDGDGLLDVFLPGGGYYDGPDKKEIKGHPNKLYKNLGNFKFKDVSAETGIDKVRFYNHGVAVADYDNDGWPDILLTGWGRMALLHNESDGKGGRHFVDVTQKAGLNSTWWSSSAGWADFDGDGHVDIYVANYVNWSFDNDPPAFLDGKTRDVAPPKYFKALPHILYRNNGDGTFTDVSKSAGLRGPRKPEDYPPLKKDYKEEALARYLKAGRKQVDAEKEAENTAEKIIQRLRQADDSKDPAYGKGLGVLIVDVNLDGKPDIYVANDTVPNFLYVNRSRPGKILFEELGMKAGVAMDDRGSARGSMGLAAGDPLGTGRPTLPVCNSENEIFGLYISECKDDQIIFRFDTQMLGMGNIGQEYVSWGTQFVDFDLGGWEDVVISSGHAIRFPGGKNKGPRAGMAPRRMLPLLLLNQGGANGRRRLKEMNRRGGEYFLTPHLGRGVAFADLNNDGRVDMVMAHMNEPAVVLKNVAGAGRHWLGVELKRSGNRDAVGSRILLEAGGRTQTRFATGGGSYASACDQRRVFGLGTCDNVDRVTVIWPTGQAQTWEGLACDRYHTLTEGAK